MRIGFDIDGVLSGGFYGAYEALVIKHAGEDKFGEHRWPQEFPCTWNWPEHYGYDPALTRFPDGPVWKEIHDSATFWMRLDPLPDMQTVRHFLDERRGVDDVYFVTDRPGRFSKSQTETWLMRQGIYHPTVILSGRKGDVAVALKLELYVDDKGENIVDVEAKSPTTRAVLIQRPYNQHVTVRERADSVAEVLQDYF